MKNKMCGSLLAILLTANCVNAQDTARVSGQLESPATEISSLKPEVIPQEDVAQKWEVTSNITLALSRFTGNVSRNLNDDPYLIMVRKLNKNGGAAWRVGINGFRHKIEDFSRLSEENSASLVIGREWRRALGSGFYTYWGLDSRGMWRHNNAVSIQFDGWGGRTEIITDAMEYGGSVGILGGIAYKPHNRITVYTESIVNGQMLQTQRSFTVNGVATSLENKNSLSVVPMVPIALFLSISF
jgi:hypothetical protein